MALLDFGPEDRAVDIVFLHANGFNALTYRAILGPLAADLRIVALDQRGHGATTLPTAPEDRADWLDLRDDLIAVLDALGIGRVVLSGHSMGGTVSLLTAAHVPRRVGGLVLFDPVILEGDATRGAPGSPMVEGALRRRAIFASRAEAVASYRGRGAFAGWPLAMLKDYVAAGFRDLPTGEVVLACNPAWEASGYAAQGHDIASAIAALACPTMIYKAERDSTCRLGVGDAATVVVQVVPGASHFLPMERPALSRAALAAGARS